MNAPTRKKTAVPAARLPRLEAAFTATLQEIAEAEGWSTARLLSEIRRMPGKTSLAAKARLFALSYYRQEKQQPSGFAENASSPLQTALYHVRHHRRR